MKTTHGKPIIFASLAGLMLSMTACEPAGNVDAPDTQEAANGDDANSDDAGNTGTDSIPQFVSLKPMTLEEKKAAITKAEADFEKENGAPDSSPIALILWDKDKLEARKAIQKMLLEQQLLGFGLTPCPNDVWDGDCTLVVVN
ncbi:hypothetical protein [Sphingorhabdus sp. Alg239-R122]|uniref:hypothetical protein n=1 Tax=Sphingorhabdus sp. Alg239-R122 TaxID=2305989 RepID=UPI0013DC082A|nr:hypothetical protein [Sphingorhabdus sp. Alg239-R122]